MRQIELLCLASSTKHACRCIAGMTPQVRVHFELEPQLYALSVTDARFAEMKT